MWCCTAALHSKGTVWKAETILNDLKFASFFIENSEPWLERDLLWGWKLWLRWVFKKRIHNFCPYPICMPSRWDVSWLWSALHMPASLQSHRPLFCYQEGFPLTKAPDLLWQKFSWTGTHVKQNKSMENLINYCVCCISCSKTLKTPQEQEFTAHVVVFWV